MIIPIRCFTCNKVMADKFDWYVEEVKKLQQKTEEKAAKVGDGKKKEVRKKGGDKQQAGAVDEFKDFDRLRTGAILDKMGLTRICCRRHMLTTVDMMETI